MGRDVVMRAKKWLLLILTLVAIAGCESPERAAYWEAERAETENRSAMLTDGRIYIGMTDKEFSRLWERAVSPQRTNSAQGYTEVWLFAVDCRPTIRMDNPNRPHVYRAWYRFTFTNGILVSWSSN